MEKVTYSFLYFRAFALAPKLLNSEQRFVDF
jgi:hypothetical protein